MGPTKGTTMCVMSYVCWICHATMSATTVCQMILWRARMPSPVRAFSQSSAVPRAPTSASVASGANVPGSMNLPARHLDDQRDADDHEDDEQAAHGGRAFLAVVRLRTIDPDALAHAQPPDGPG